MSRPKQRMIHPLGACVAALVLVSTLVLVVEPSASAATGGTRLWVSRYETSGDDFAEAVAVSPDGSKVFVTGGGGGTQVYATIAYDASTGAMLWLARYNGPGNSGEALSMAVSPDGSKVFVTGYSRGIATGGDYATVAYDASTGSTLWAKRYDGTGSSADGATSLAVSPDGSKVFITGASLGVTGSMDYATIAYAASTGARLWLKRYNGPGNDYDAGESVRVSPDGSEVFVTGYSVGASRYLNYATIAYDASNGARLWVARYGRQGYYTSLSQRLGVPSLAVSPDSSKVFVTGESRGDYGTVAYQASSGVSLWAEHYNGPGDGVDIATSIGVSPDGSEVFVTGTSPGITTRRDYATIAYDASAGATLWINRYNGPGDWIDYPRSLAVSPDGSEVFINGWSQGSTTGLDDTTVAYQASDGTRLWVNRYNGTGNGDDYAASVVAVSPDGSKVFVTGWSAGTITGQDYATVAYAA